MPARNMKSAMIHCASGEKPSSESAWVEKPPVGIVVNAWASASYGVIASSIPSQPSDASRSVSEHGQRDVEDPQHPGERADPLAERGDLGARELGLHHLPAADAEAREDRDREDDDPHPAEPLGELAPHVDRWARARRSP